MWNVLPPRVFHHIATMPQMRAGKPGFGPKASRVSARLGVEVAWAFWPGRMQSMMCCSEGNPKSQRASPPDSTSETRDSFELYPHAGMAQTRTGRTGRTSVVARGYSSNQSPKQVQCWILFEGSIIHTDQNSALDRSDAGGFSKRLATPCLPRNMSNHLPQHENTIE